MAAVAAVAAAAAAQRFGDSAGARATAAPPAVPTARRVPLATPGTASASLEGGGGGEGGRQRGKRGTDGGRSSCCPFFLAACRRPSWGLGQTRAFADCGQRGEGGADSCLVSPHHRAHVPTPRVSARHDAGNVARVRRSPLPPSRPRTPFCGEGPSLLGAKGPREGSSPTLPPLPPPSLPLPKMSDPRLGGGPNLVCPCPRRALAPVTGFQAPPSPSASGATPPHCVSLTGIKTGRLDSSSSRSTCPLTPRRRGGRRLGNSPSSGPQPP